MDELMRPLSQFDVWMLTACLRVGFFVAIAMPATVVGVLCWVAGEYVGRRDSKVHPSLTNDERMAIEFAIEFLQPVGNYDSLAQDTLRKLLERLKPSK